jgi:phosphinothricin acetyltransferase
MSSIRIATTDDSESILKIYAPYIENTSYTFETEVPTIDSFKKRFLLTYKTGPGLFVKLME